jgi:predicted AAA+ superfamily ATPase
LNDNTPFYYIIGKPACGKSTFMKLLLKGFTEKALKDENAPIPLFIPISSLSNLNMIDNEYTVENLLKGNTSILQ